MKRRWLLLQSLALALVLTWPGAVLTGGRALGSVDGDGAKHLWTLWWMRREAWTGPWGLRTVLVNHPDGMDIWPIEPVNGLVAALLPLNPVPLSNLLALVHVALFGLAAGWLGWLVTRRAAGAHAAAALAQGAAFTGFTLDVGVGELRQLWWVPLGLALQQVALQSGRWRDYLLVGACVGLATLACLYYGFFLGLAVGGIAFVQPAPGRYRRWFAAGVLALLLVAVPVRTFSRTWAPEAGPGEMGFSAWMEAAARTRLQTFPTEAAQLDQLVIPASWREGWSPPQGDVYVGGRYLGLVALALACLGVAAEPRRALPWLVVGVAGTVLSLGAVVWVDGRIVEVGGSRVVLPLAWINRALGWVAEPVNFPARFLLVPMVSLAILGAFATRWRWTWALVPLALLDVGAHSRSSWPRASFVLPDTTGLEAARGEGAVANLTPFVVPGPAPTGAVGDSILRRKDAPGRLRAIAAQIRLDAPFDIVPIERMDYWGAGGLLWLSALPLAAELGAPPAGQPDHRADWWLLRDRGFDRVLVTHDEVHVTHEGWWRSLAAELGTPVSSPSATVWTVPVTDARPEEAEAWRAQQAARVQALPRPVQGVAHPERLSE